MKNKLIFSLLIIFTFSSLWGKDTKKSYSGGKPWIASDIQQNISKKTEVSPKDDFHLYVNKDWLLSAKIEKGHSSASSFSIVSDEITENIQKVFEEKNPSTKDEKLILKAYTEWLDWKKRNQTGYSPILPIVEQINSISTINEMNDFLCNKDTFLVAPNLLDISTSSDMMNSSRYSVYLDGQSLLLNDSNDYRELSESGEILKDASHDLLIFMLNKVGFSKNDAEKIFNDAFDYETELAESIPTNDEQNRPEYLDTIYNPYTQAKLKQESPAFPIIQIIETSGFNKTNNFILLNPDWLKKINELYTNDNLQKIKADLLVHLLLDNAELLDKKTFDQYIKFGNKINGINSRKEDKYLAADFVQSILFEQLDRVYIKKFISPDTKAEIHKICEEVIHNYTMMLQQENWLDENTKKNAIKKVNAIQINALYPEKFKDDSKLNFEDNYNLSDIVNAVLEYYHELQISNINQSIDKDLWDFDILQTNAYYNPQMNSITILTGIIGGVFYSSDMSIEEKYAGIGSVIGHEISHAFDSNGALFDEKGNYTNWWTEKDKAEFKKRTDKMAAYYNKIIPFEGSKYRGDNVVTEATADICGIKCILSIAKNIKDFDYDKFFRSYASVWKQIQTTARLQMIIDIGEVHPLNFLRTNVTLQQFDEFLNLYEIKPGDNMYLAPADRIQIW